MGCVPIYSRHPALNCPDRWGGVIARSGVGTERRGSSKEATGCGDVFVALRVQAFQPFTAPKPFRGGRSLTVCAMCRRVGVQQPVPSDRALRVGNPRFGVVCDQA